MRLAKVSYERRPSCESFYRIEIDPKWETIEVSFGGLDGANIVVLLEAVIRVVDEFYKETGHFVKRKRVSSGN